MPFLIDTDVLVDVSRNTQAAIACLDSFGNDWALSAMTALELISAATAIEKHHTLVTRNRKHFGMVDGLAMEIPQY